MSSFQHAPTAPGEDAADATTGALVVSGGLWNVLARVAPQAYTLIVSVVAARYLGPDGMGRQSFIAFVELSLVALASSGFSTSLMRYISEAVGRGRADAVRSLMRWAWGVQAIAAVIGGTVLAGAGLLGADPHAAWVLAAVVAVSGILQTVPSAVLIGLQRLRAAALVGLVSGTVGTPVTIAVLAAHGGIVGMFAVEAAVVTVNLAVTGVLARRTVLAVAPRPGPAGELPREVMRFALFTTIGVVLTLIVWRRSEFFFLERYSSDAEVAFYSIAFAVMTALILVPESLTGALSPAFATLHGAGARERLRSGYGRTLRLLLFASLPITAGALAVGPTALGLIYGHDFRGTGPVLTIMLVLFPLVSISSVTSALMLALARVRIPMIIGIAAAVATISLNLLLVPRLDAIGAALANAGGQLTATIPILVYANREVGPVAWIRWELLRAALTSASAGLTAWALVSLIGGVAGVIVAVVAGAAVFVGVGNRLRILPEDDSRWAEQVVGLRLGGVVAAFCRLLAGRPWAAESA